MDRKVMARSLSRLLVYIAVFEFLLLSSAPASPVHKNIGDGCEAISLSDNDALAAHINAHGSEEFTNPPEARPVTEEDKLVLVVTYNVVTLAGCTAKLRTYNGKTVGPTIRAKPGDTLFIRLENALPPAKHEHPQIPPPPGHAQHFSFNITNLHTHGLHVAPEGDGPVDPETGRRKIESDNVLIELRPGEEQEYQIKIPEDHASGTFWYHAHVHGGTAVQVGSGMAGALIIDGGEKRHGDLDTIPEIGSVSNNEKIMVIQQTWIDKTGHIERSPSTRRPELINGQLVPVIKLRAGELQRWRLIHAGVNENLALSLDDHELHEVAADGISLGRRVAWPSFEPPVDGSRDDMLFLAPGYRSDVLVKISPDAQPGKVFFLRRHRLPNDISIQAMNARANALIDSGLESSILAVEPDDLDEGNSNQVLLKVEIIEGAPIQTSLPSNASLAEVVPEELKDITQAEIDRTAAQDPGANRSIELTMAVAKCDPQTGNCVPCSPGDGGCRISFMVNNKQFTMNNGIKPLRLKTGGEWTASEWRVSSGGPLLPATHPFHIHVNPFQVQRTEPDGVKRWRWKDTWLTYSNGAEGILKMRYRVFTGKFVLHCHILDHEDKGMMSVVEIIN